MQSNMAEFLKMKYFAVFGASDQKGEQGYKIIRRLHKLGYRVYPINPRIAKIQNMRCYGTLDELPVSPQVIVVALPPEPALEVIRCGAIHGIRRFWIQPDSESDDLLTFISENGLVAVHSECLLEKLENKK